MADASSRARTPRLAVLVSGEGTNLQALIDAAASGALGGEVSLVASDRPAARGLERARQAGIEALALPPRGFRGRAAYDEALAAAVAEREPDLVVLAGFMRILGAPFLERFAGRILNVHPSLLPKYRGLDTHRRVLEAGDELHGASVHFVTAELDAGPLVIQYRLRVRPDDTPATLAERVHVGEHIILPRAAGWFLAGRLREEGGRAVLDGRPLDEPVIVEADS
ncbi:MAG TPA: phosphoribosylglycinamide formyltransferase [Gammaproteobacteria bacterium]